MGLKQIKGLDSTTTQGNENLASGHRLSCRKQTLDVSFRGTQYLINTDGYGKAWALLGLYPGRLWFEAEGAAL